MEKGNHKEKILQNAPFGYAYHRIVLDESGRAVDYQFLEVNLSFERLTGLNREEILGKNARDVLPGLKEEPFDWLQEYAEIALKGGEKELIQHSEIFQRTFRIHVYSPEKYYFSTIFYDISTEVSTRQKLQNTEVCICQMEDRTDHVQKEKYKHQIAVARESVRFKQNFLANMSHEIRTPLTGIMGVIDILSEAEHSAEKKEHMEILKNTSENLMEIVNQVLDFSKIEDGKLTLKKVDFNFHQFLHQSMLFYKKLCCDAVSISLELQPDIPEFIYADKSRLSQILNNLLSNAVKFTEKGSIHLEASIIEEENEKPGKCREELFIKVAVSDTGIGIEAEKLKGLFKPFAQMDDSDIRKYEGTGLGLSISKQLAELHGGKTGAVSKPAKGSTFWFTFRAGKMAEELVSQANSQDKKTGPLKNLRILLAEDKAINQKVITILLKHMGHRVTLAADGGEVIKLYETGAFDLILMDIQMPVMDGVSATRTLREKHNDLPPIVGLSANAFEGDREKYMAVGMDDYLTKPLRKEAFMEMLERVFGF